MTTMTNIRHFDDVAAAVESTPGLTWKVEGHLDGWISAGDLLTGIEVRGIHGLSLTLYIDHSGHRNSSYIERTDGTVNLAGAIDRLVALSVAADQETDR